MGIPLDVFKGTHPDRNTRPELWNEKKRSRNSSAELSADQLLERSIKDRAKEMATTLSKFGIKRFGPTSMWSEESGVLPDGRNVRLQSSVGALEVNIGATDEIPETTHIRCNLAAGKVNTYEIRQPDGRPIIFYDMPSESKFPTTLVLSDVLKGVGEVLTQAELITKRLKTK